MVRSILLVILFAFSGSVFADDFNYNNVNISYGQISFDDPGGDADGDMFGVDGSFEIGESLFLVAGYNQGDLEDDFGFGVDVDMWRAGIGYHASVSEQLDFVGTLTYENAEISALGLSLDDGGIGASIGLRYAASEAFEVTGGINYADRGDLEPLIDETSFEAGFLYNFTDSFSVGLNGEWGGDLTTYSLGGRFYFGQ